MTLQEALRERAAEERDALVEALFAPLTDPRAAVMTKHRAAVTIIERLIGKPREALAVNEPMATLTLEQLADVWARQGEEPEEAQ
jgi:hypothetical protein